jgi:hypothetical protein
MSGWGGAKGKIAKYVLICKNAEEADIVYENARHRSEMKYISVGTALPKYDPKRYQVSIADKSKAANWYKAGYFKNN